MGPQITERRGRALFPRQPLPTATRRPSRETTFRCAQSIARGCSEFSRSSTSHLGFSVRRKYFGLLFTKSIFLMRSLLFSKSHWPWCPALQTENRAADPDTTLSSVSSKRCSKNTFQVPKLCLSRHMTVFRPLLSKLKSGSSQAGIQSFHLF